MAKRTFLQLAHVFNPNKHQIAGWYASEKLDGHRCFWDGGISRGLLKSQVPWANCYKDERYVDEQICTGLWSRYGNVIHAPDSWLNYLPKVPLDGELFIRRGRGGRQQLSTVIKCLEKDSEAWTKVKFYCFDIPSFNEIFKHGYISETNFSKIMDGCKEWAFDRASNFTIDPFHSLIFKQVAFKLKVLLGENPVVVPHTQTQLPFQTQLAEKVAKEMMDYIIDQDGEGLIIRDPISIWQPERVHSMVKLKEVNDDEAIIVGYTTGRETDKGSKHLGRIGALITDYKGLRLELSGLTDSERCFSTTEAEEWAKANPGCDAPVWCSSSTFKLGDKITFRYRDLSADGIPQEARYWRRRED